jgi:plasmid maintenance system antidote protein VapI
MTDAQTFDRILGAKLRYHIMVSGLSDSEVADLMELPRYTLRRHVRGTVKVSAEQTVRYAQVLGVDPSDLLPRLDSNQEPTGSRIAA